MQRQKKNFIITKIVILFFNIILYFTSNLLASSNCKDIFQFLYQTAGLKDVLKENIFNSYGSSGINYRNIVTTPLGLYYNNIDSLFNNFSLNLFYLSTSGGVLFGNNNTLSALINTRGLVNLYNEKIINFLQHTPYASINVPFLGEAFDYINIIQKRLGFILQGGYELQDNIFIYVQLPFTYNILYPSIPSELQGVISMEIAQFGFNPNELEKNITQNTKTGRDIIIAHSVCDTFGLDKSVIGLYAKWLDETINTELRILLPGRDIAQNNIGGNFEKAKNTITSLNLKKLLINLINNINISAVDIDELKSKLLIGFDRLVLGSYYSPLAYQAGGISPSLLYHIPCGNQIFIDGYLTYIYNFSQSRLGCGIHAYNNQLNETINFETLSLENACKDLDIFTKILEQKLIPDLCPGTFYSGDEYQGALSIRSTISDMSMVLGVDLWYKSQSSFLPTSPTMLLIHSGNSATQLNGFFNFEYYTHLFAMPLTIGFIYQATVYANGIGGEYGGKIQLTMQY